MAVVLIVLIVTFGIIAYHAMKEPTHVTCICGAEITSKSNDEIGTFQFNHFWCRTRKSNAG